MKYQSPCTKDCPDRVAEPKNCHTYCEKYLDYLEIHKKEKARIYKEKELDQQLNRMENNRIAQMRIGNKPNALKRNNQKGRRGI